MKRTKVLQFLIGNIRGGITQYALQNWQFIDRNRFQFDFVTRSSRLDFATDLEKEGCKIHYISCTSEENEEQFIKEINAILDESYDAVHLHTTFWKGYLVEKLAMERKCPVVIIHAHNTMVDLQDLDKRNEYIFKHNYYRNTLPIDYATAFCACSKAAAEWLYGEQIPRDRIHILKNAIDIEKYNFNQEMRNNYRKRLKLQDCFVIGHIGRFAYAKNHEMLIEIFRGVYDKVPNARLMLVGDGELKTEIIHKVEEYGLEQAVLILGKRDDVPHLLQAMDVFLLPSRFEGLGLVLIEAQASGLKCFASENIPRESKLTSNLKFMSNSFSDWVDSILKLADGYERKKQDHLIRARGYDLKEHIRILEKLYVGEDISKDCLSAID